ncbi:MAG: sugar ABC transporter permease [Eubacteriales bacterium]|nr:sugar ABC transporter permease [Eubacteriales bacterium]
MNNAKVKLNKKSFLHSASLDKRKARAGWIFVLPFVLGLVLIYLPIIIDSFWYSFASIGYDDEGLIVTQFEGIKFYKEAITTDAQYSQKLVEGIKDLVFDTPAIVIFSLFVAVILNQNMLGRAVFRAIFFVPVIISTGLMESINAADTVSQIMGSGGIDDGSGTNTTDQIVSAVDIEQLFSSMKVGTEIVDYVTQLVNDIYNIVNRSGVQMLIFLAGLQSISPAIYEACQIEGATAWETFWKVTFPMISPMILVNSVYTIIDAFTSETNVVMSYVADVKNNSLASAMYWMYFLIIMAIIGVVVAIASCFVFYQKRD